MKRALRKAAGKHQSASVCIALRTAKLTVGDNRVRPAYPLAPEAEDDAAVLVLVSGRHGERQKRGVFSDEITAPSGASEGVARDDERRTRGQEQVVRFGTASAASNGCLGACRDGARLKRDVRLSPAGPLHPRVGRARAGGRIGQCLPRAEDSSLIGLAGGATDVGQSNH